MAAAFWILGALYRLAAASWEQDLLKGYEARVRPPNPKNASAGLPITVALLPLYLEDISETEGVATLYYDIDLKWIDNRLMWNDSIPGRKECIFVEMEQLWVPYLRFKNALSQKMDRDETYPTRVCSNGLINIFYTTRLQVSGKFNIKDFPFDTQTIVSFFCHPSAGSQEVDLVMSPDVSMAPPDTIIEWNYRNYSCERNEVPSIGSEFPQMHVFVGCTLTVDRNPRYYIVNFAIPSAAVTLLAVLGTHSASAVLGPRTTKYQLGLTALMATSVLTLSIVGMLPRSEEVSRLHLYYYGLIGIIVSATVTSWATMVSERWVVRRRRKRVSIGGNSVSYRSLPTASHPSIPNGDLSASPPPPQARRQTLRRLSQFQPQPDGCLESLLESRLIDIGSGAVHLTGLFALLLWFCLDIKFSSSATAF